MLGVLADDHDTAFSLNDLALFADLFNGWLYLHCTTPFLSLALFSTPSDTSFVKVVYGYFNSNLITRQNSDIIHAQLSGDMCGDNMLIRQLNLEGSIRQCFDYRTFEFDNVVLRQNNPSYASSCVILSTFCR